MKKLILAISVFILFGSSFANAEQVYYCSSEIATGFKKDKKTGKWGQRNFILERYTIKFNDDYTKLDGVDNVEKWDCFKAYTYSIGTENLRICHHSFNSGKLFQFNRKSLRFLYAETPATGFLENGPDTNTIFAGTCQKY